MNFLRTGLRRLLREPGFSLTVIVTLALGIGSTTAAFTLVNAILLQPPPYSQPERLVAVYTSSSQTVQYNTSAYQDVLDWQEQSETLDSIAPFANWRELNLTGGEEPERVLVGMVADNYFPILGIDAAHGRTFTAEEDALPGGIAVALLGHDLWQRSFSGDPAIVGRTIQLNNTGYTVVGVLPQDFKDVAAHGDVQLWVPVTRAREILRPSAIENRTARWLSVIARLGEGETPESAERELNAIADGLAEQYPDTNQDLQIHVRPLDHYLYENRDMDRATLLPLLAAAFVLLIACANIANLLIVRSMRRKQDLAVRLAMGARIRQLVIGLLGESLFLGLIGGAIGVLLAQRAVAFLLQASPIVMPSYVDVSIDGRVLLVALVLSILASVAFGLAPALGIQKINLREPLSHGSARGAVGGRGVGALRNAFIVFEVALATVLLIGAVLMIQNFLAFRSVGLGFEQQNLVLMQTELTDERYSEPEVLRAFYDVAEDSMVQVPGVVEAGTWSPYRPGLSWAYSEIVPEGRIGDVQEERVRAWQHRITVGSLETVGTPLVRGRLFNAQDTADSPRVSVFSEAMAEATWPGQDPIGKRFGIGGTGVDHPWVTVVGVVSDARHRGRGPIDHDPKDFYIPLEQMPLTRLTFMARTDIPGEGLKLQIRNALRAADPGMPVFNISTMDELLHTEESENRFYAQVLGFLAAVALLLAALGIYAVLSYSVSQRTQEIGVRRAFGAQPGKVLKLVGGQALLLVLLGLGIGLIAAVALSQFIASLVHGVDTGHPAYYALISGILLATALAAIYVPVRRALRVDPAVALRYE
ncbi:MAG: ABC transporter permease [Acidobacteriota bacterium]